MIRKILLNILTRSFWLYLAAFLIVSSMVDLNGTVNEIKLTTLNRLRPENFDLLKDISGNKNGQVTRETLQPYIFYYEQINKVVPNRADSYGLIGFCEYYSGETEKSLMAYEKAVALNPTFFWYYYNLAKIHYSSGDLDESVLSMKKAIQSNPTVSVKYIAQSVRIYMSLFQGNERLDKYLINQIRDGYEEMYRMLVLVKFEQNDFAPMVQYSLLAIKEGQVDQAVFYYYAGLGAFHLGNYQVSANFLKHSLESGPERREIYELLLKNYQKMGNEKAVQLFTVLKNKPQLENFPPHVLTIDRTLALY